MPTWRAKVLNAADPTAPRSMAPAAVPPYTPTPYSVHGGQIRLAGAPGTVAVPSPPPPATRTRAVGSNPPDLRPSDCSPDAFLPRLFVQYPDNLHPPVRIASTNEIPIPAGNFVRLPQIASQAPARLGGTAVIPAPRAFTRWPSAVAGYPSA